MPLSGRPCRRASRAGRPSTERGRSCRVPSPVARHSRRALHPNDATASRYSLPSPLRNRARLDTFGGGAVNRSPNITLQRAGDRVARCRPLTLSVARRRDVPVNRGMYFETTQPARRRLLKRHVGGPVEVTPRTIVDVQNGLPIKRG